MNTTDLPGHRAAPVTRRYDAIVVGARCAGAATAMLLARKGYKVLLVDRASFPSNTVSTHVIHPPGLTALQRWGLLDDLVATGCPWLPAYTFDLGPLVITGTPTAADGTAGSYAPRRIVLDELLVRAAGKAGAELREGFSVTELIIDGDRITGVRGHARGGTEVSEYARVVIGADGVHSRVAEQANAPRYREGPVLTGAYYAYWSGVPATGALWMLRPGRGYGLIPTNDDLTLVLAAWPQAEAARVKQDLQGNYLREVTAALGGRLDGGRRRPASWAKECRTGSGHRTDRAGRWSVMPGTPRIRSPPRASPTPSTTPSYAPTRSTPYGAAAAATTRRWASTSSAATSGCCRCTSSPVSSPTWPCPAAGDAATAGRDRR